MEASQRFDPADRAVGVGRPISAFSVDPRFEGGLQRFMILPKQRTRRQHLEILGKAGAAVLVLGPACTPSADTTKAKSSADAPKPTTKPAKAAVPAEAPASAPAEKPAEAAAPAEKTAETPPEAPADAASEGASEKTATFDLEVGDGISYNIKEMKVAAGSMVTVNIKHTGKLPSVAMGHNFVLIKNSVTMADFGTKAMAANKTQYIPEEMKDQVIAHTKLVGGGESDSVTFSAPAPGTYVYLCTFPGHYGLMNGKFIVE